MNRMFILVIYNVRQRCYLDNRLQCTAALLFRPTPDGAVHRPDGTPNMTSPHLTMKKKNIYLSHACCIMNLKTNYART